MSLRELVKQKDPIDLSDLKFDDKNYVVPIFNWRKPKFIESRSKKLDYIYVFSDKQVFTPEKLTKVFTKRKHTVPGPEHYDMIRHWGKRSTKDYERQRGKQYHTDRITDTHALIKSVKKAKLPAPNAYKPTLRTRILGPSNSNARQLQWIDN